MSGFDPGIFPEDSLLGRCGAAAGRLSSFWVETSFPAGATIVAAEDDDDDVYAVLSGRVRAATFTSTGKEVRFAEMGPGEVFGLCAALDGRCRSANMIAVTDTRVGRIPGARFREVVAADGTACQALLLYLVGWARALSEQITRMTALTAEQRLVVELLDRARPLDGDPDRAEVAPMPTQTEIATLIHGQREAVSRDLRALRELGLVERSRRGLILTSLAGLRARLPR